MKRGRMLQVALGLVGLAYVALIYPLYTDLAHSEWLLEMKDACETMFLSWFIADGVHRDLRITVADQQQYAIPLIVAGASNIRY